MLLFSGLVLLVALSLLALVASASMLLQQRMAGNFSDSQRATYAAQRAIAEAEREIFRLDADQRAADCLASCFSALGELTIYAPGQLPARPENESPGWWDSWSSSVGGAQEGEETEGTLPGFGDDSDFYLVEEIHFDTDIAGSVAADAVPVRGVGFYRMLGRGSGYAEQSVSVAEAIVARPWALNGSAGDGLAEGVEDTSETGSNDQPADSFDQFCEPFLPHYPCGRLVQRMRR